MVDKEFASKVFKVIKISNEGVDVESALLVCQSAVALLIVMCADQAKEIDYPEFRDTSLGFIKTRTDQIKACLW